MKVKNIIFQTAKCPKSSVNYTGTSELLTNEFFSDYNSGYWRPGLKEKNIAKTENNFESNLWRFLKPGEFTKIGDKYESFFNGKVVYYNAQPGIIVNGCLRFKRKIVSNKDF